MNDLISKIDSDRFGIKVAKINDPKFITPLTFSQLKNDGVKLVISRVPSEQIALINAMEDLGYRVKDVQLTYKFDLNKNEISYNYENKTLVIREANKNDVEQLKNIAVDCFWEYGHYFADPNLRKSDCMEVYIDWTMNAVLDSNFADKFFVAEFENKILGYLFFKLKGIEKGIYSYSGLGAVSSESRGGNVFSTLVIKSLEWAKSEGHLWQEHNVLNINYPVNKVFSKLGFSNYKSETTLHLWLS